MPSEACLYGKSDSNRDKAGGPLKPICDKKRVLYDTEPVFRCRLNASDGI